MVVDLGRRVGLKISGPVAARIAANCSNDQAIVAQELQKFSLYVDASSHSPKELDHEAIDAVGFHPFPFPIGGADGLYSMSSAVKDTRRV